MRSRVIVGAALLALLGTSCNDDDSSSTSGDGGTAVAEFADRLQLLNEYEEAFPFESAKAVASQVDRVGSGHLVKIAPGPRFDNGVDADGQTMYTDTVVFEILTSADDAVRPQETIHVMTYANPSLLPETEPDRPVIYFFLKKVVFPPGADVKMVGPFSDASSRGSLYWPAHPAGLQVVDAGTSLAFPLITEHQVPPTADNLAFFSALDPALHGFGKLVRGPSGIGVVSATED